MSVSQHNMTDSICVSQHQALFDKREAYHKIKDLKDNNASPIRPLCLGLGSNGIGAAKHFTFEHNQHELK